MMYAIAKTYWSYLRLSLLAMGTTATYLASLSGLHFLGRAALKALLALLPTPVPVGGAEHFAFTIVSFAVSVEITAEVAFVMVRIIYPPRESRIDSWASAVKKAAAVFSSQ